MITNSNPLKKLSKLIDNQILLVMRNFIKNRFLEIITDKYQLIHCLVAVLLACSNFYLLAFDKNAIHPLPRAIFWTIFVPVAFVLGRNAINIMILIYANLMVYFIKYDNYTFAVFTLLFYYSYTKTKYIKWLALASYIIQVLIIIQLHHLSSMHIIIHFGVSLILFVKLFDLLKNSKNSKLTLTVDEVKILDNLKNGIKQNDIVGVSAQTVSRKLKAARDRNGLKDNNSLLSAYIAQIDAK